VDDSPGRWRILREFYEIKKILIGNCNWFYNNIWTVVCVILTHIDAVWQFRQIQTPEDGHTGPKHIVLSESGKKKIICCITDGLDIHRQLKLHCLQWAIVNRTVLQQWTSILVVLGNAFTQPLVGNGYFLRFHYSGFQASCHNMYGSSNIWSLWILHLYIQPGPRNKRWVFLCMSYRSGA
jgi:hypothetical protein